MPNGTTNGNTYVNGTTNGATNGTTNGFINGMSNSRPHTNGTSSSNHDSHRTPSAPPIAIVGMSCKFGGDATDASKFWDLCCAGKDSWTPIPRERFNAEGLYHPDGLKTGRVSNSIE